MPEIVVEIDLAAELATGDGIPLTTLAQQHRTNPSTVWRWVQKGLPCGDGTRVRLEALRRGKKWLTSPAAVKRFFGALPTSTPTPTAPVIRSPAKRERDCGRAKQTLNTKYGI